MKIWRIKIVKFVILKIKFRKRLRRESFWRWIEKLRMNSKLINLCTWLVAHRWWWECKWIITNQELWIWQVTLKCLVKCRWLVVLQVFWTWLATHKCWLKCKWGQTLPIFQWSKICLFRALRLISIECQWDLAPPVSVLLKVHCWSD